MRLSLLPNGWKDYLYWQENDRNILKRVNELIRDALRNPFSGMGKSEPLRNNLKGWWSRRITREHPPIYKVEAETILIMQRRLLSHTTFSATSAALREKSERIPIMVSMRHFRY